MTAAPKEMDQKQQMARESTRIREGLCDRSAYGCDCAWNRAAYLSLCDGGPYEVLTCIDRLPEILEVLLRPDSRILST